LTAIYNKRYLTVADDEWHCHKKSAGQQLLHITKRSTAATKNNNCNLTVAKKIVVAPAAF
jgi:hypothetical protein